MTAPASGQQAADWTQERERSNLRAMRLMRWFAMTAGRTLARALLHPITLYFLLFGGKARRASRGYLKRVLGRPATLADVYRHIHCFASTILDRVYLLQGRHELFDVDCRDVEAIDQSLKDGTGAMLVGAHLGSFEALRATAEARGARVAMVMYEDNARLINTTLAAIAPGVQLSTIALGRPGTMLTLKRWLDEGGMAGLLADRTLPTQSGRTRTLQLAFLGQEAPFSDGPFRLAAMLRRKVVMMAGLYHGGNRYELRFVELADFRQVAAAGADLDALIVAATKRYVALLEGLCREAPYNWFNFYDFWGADANPVAVAKPAVP